MYILKIRKEKKSGKINFFRLQCGGYSCLYCFMTTNSIDKRSCTFVRTPGYGTSSAFRWEYCHMTALTLYQLYNMTFVPILSLFSMSSVWIGQLLYFSAACFYQLYLKMRYVNLEFFKKGKSDIASGRYIICLKHTLIGYRHWDRKLEDWKLSQSQTTGPSRALSSTVQSTVVIEWVRLSLQVLGSWCLRSSRSMHVPLPPTPVPPTQALTMCINYELPYTYVPGDPPLLRMPLPLKGRAHPLIRAQIYGHTKIKNKIPKQ